MTSKSSPLPTLDPMLGTEHTRREILICRESLKAQKSGFEALQSDFKVVVKGSSLSSWSPVCGTISNVVEPLAGQAWLAEAGY